MHEVGGLYSGPNLTNMSNYTVVEVQMVHFANSDFKQALATKLTEEHIEIAA